MSNLLFYTQTQTGLIRPVVSRSPSFLSNHARHPPRPQVRPSIQAQLHRAAAHPGSHSSDDRARSASRLTNGCHIHGMQQSRDDRRPRDLQQSHMHSCRRRRSQSRRKQVAVKIRRWRRIWQTKEEQKLQDSVTSNDSDVLLMLLYRYRERRPCVP